MRLSDFKVASKIFMVSFVTILLILAAALFFLMPYMEQRIMEEKEASLRQVVEIASSITAGYETAAGRGEMSEDAAKQAAMHEIGQMRYDGNNYLWINDMEPRMIMHPNYPREKKPEWYETRGLTSYADSYGTRLFIEMVKVCNASGEGFVPYYWTKPGQEHEKPFPKLSYVKLFKPWGWVIGSGAYTDDVQRHVGRIRWVVIGGTLAVAVITLFLTSVFGMMIVGPLKQVGMRIKDIVEGEGDLTKRLNVVQKDEIGEVAGWFDVFVEKLHAIIAQVASAVVRVMTAAHALSDTARQMVANVDQQTAQTTQVAASMEEMRATIQEVAKNTSLAATRAINTGQTALAGKDAVDQAGAGINTIADTMKKLQTMILDLAKSSDRIGEIVEVIDELADQTNMLALNAAIEAARAGDQGRGFAVVADEVRKLAERTTASTREITRFVQDMQKEMKQAAREAQASGEQVVAGLSLSRKAGESLVEIVKNAKAVEDMIQQIATAAEEQSAAADEISSNVEGIAATSKQNAQSCQQTAAASEEINRKIEELREMISKFKLRDTGGDSRG